MSFFTRPKAVTPNQPKRSRKDTCRTLAAACLAMLVFAGLGWALVAVGTDNEAEAQSFATCPAGQVPRGQRLDSASECVPCPTTSRTIPSGCDGYTTNSTPPSSSSTTTTTTTAVPDIDPPFEAADIQAAYSRRTATQPTGACGVAGRNSQYATYYAELAADWCSVVMVFTPTSFTDYLRLDINIIGLNQSGELPTEQLLNTVAAGALTMRVQRGTSEITCTAPGTGWSNTYFSEPRQIYLGRVFRCQSHITPTSSITINTIATTATTTTTTTSTTTTTTTTTSTTTTTTTTVVPDIDPPFEPADIQRAYSRRTATQPTGACGVAGRNSQYATYYAELAADWCSVVMVFTPTSFTDYLRLDINIIGLNQSGELPTEQLLNTVAAGALTMRVQGGTSEITCSAPGTGWSNAYFSDPRQIYLGRVFRCQSHITPASSITINTIATTPTTTTPQGDN